MSVIRPSSSSEYRRSASPEGRRNSNGNSSSNGCAKNDGGQGQQQQADKDTPRSGSCCSSLLSGSGLAFWSLMCLLLATFVSLQFFLPKAASSCVCPASEPILGLNGHPYNASKIGGPKILPDGRVQYEIAVVSDLDHGSKMADKKDTWRSFLRRGHLFFHPEHMSVKVEWYNAGEDALYSQLAFGGRAMELSDLCVYDGHLLTVDDRTGVVYKIDNFRDMIPWVLLNDGSGNSTKAFKGEWMTVKDRRLYVGGLGKEWTTVEGKFINYNPMFVKVINPNGEILHMDWTDRYKALRRKIGVEFPGYMIHESGQWSDVHKKWFFLPRRASNDTYSETVDERMGINVLLIADENFEKIEARYIGSRGDGYRGFGAFQFLPHTNDDVLVAVKTEERDGKAVASYLFIYRLSDDRVLLDEQKFDGPYKFEGLIVF